MWLTKQLAKPGGLHLHSGLVQQGEGFSVQGERAFQSPQQVGPYGVSSRAQEGREALMLDGYCTGVVAAADSTLKNNGDVVINGQAFHPVSEV